jgi:preprotein translocase subunit SecD
MKIMLIALLGSVLLAQNRPLPNGVYSVQEGKANGKTLVARQFEGKDVVLDTSNFAPLTLSGKPEVGGDNSGQSWLNVQLAPEAAKRLEALTRSHIDRPIAIVVGDKVLSTPVVRSVISDGTARVTPCDDAKCATLLRQLSQ